ncbi:MAG: TrbI/VirB10 family protein [Caulobacteraceae bacterium]
MTDTPSQKVDPATLSLKASPRRVVRFKRNVVIAAVAAACVVICLIAWLSLKGPGLPHAKSDGGLVSTDHKPMPEGLATLPSTYGQSPRTVPVLGGPLPGDLGPPILERQNQLRAMAASGAASDNEARAEKQRLEQQAEQVQSAGVFFQVGQHAGVGAGSAAVTSTTAAVNPDATSASAATAPSKLPLDLDHDQNNQQRKLEFMAQGAKGAVNEHALQTLGSPDTVMAGSVIAASLLTGLNSDLPGMVTAQVTENVYDTVTGKILLIPQGSRLLGAYDSVVAFGQSRALLVWQRLILPDGASIQIDNLPATDAAGYAGLKDQVDYHTWTLLKGIAMSTLIGVGGQVAFGNSSSNLVEAIRESTQESTNQAGQRIVEKDLNIQPTLTVRPGWPLRVIVHKDLVLRPYRS